MAAPLPAEVREAIGREYVTGSLTMRQVAQRHNVAVATVYRCVQRYLNPNWRRYDCWWQYHKADSADA